MSVEVGQEAPDFTLPDQDLKPWSLSGLRGRTVVLAFFPAAFTPVCTKEMCTFRDQLGQFNQLDAQVLGISVDSPFTLKAFAEANRLNFPLLSDYRREVIRLYGVVHQDFVGLEGFAAAKRAVFVVDREGRVAYRWVSEDPRKEPDYGRVREEVGRLEKG
jgi:peroxiredoxin